MNEGIIYRIFNIKTDKSYIGKTTRSIYERLEDHLKKMDNTDYPLYRAFRKYGLNGFSLEILGYFPLDELDSKEIIFINKFNTYKNGYNATLGGEGRKTIKHSDEEIIKDYLISKSLTITAEKFNIDRTSVKRILLRNNIKLFNDGLFGRIVPNIRKPVYCKTLDLQFQSLTECSQYLIDNGYANGTVKSINSSLTKACTGKRKTYKKLQFEYI